MRTEAQAEAARRNGAHSRGPLTEEGKERSRANALRHGLAAEKLVGPTEEAGGFEATRESFVRDLAPRGQVEEALVERIALAHWRLQRAAVMESRLMRRQWQQALERTVEEWREQPERRRLRALEKEAESARMRAAATARLAGVDGLTPAEAAEARETAETSRARAEEAAAEAAKTRAELSGDPCPRRPAEADLDFATAEGLSGPSCGLEVVGRYERRIERGFHLALKALRELQALRGPREGRPEQGPAAPRDGAGDSRGDETRGARGEDASESAACGVRRLDAALAGEASPAPHSDGAASESQTYGVRCPGTALGNGARPTWRTVGALSEPTVTTEGTSTDCTDSTDKKATEEETHPQIPQIRE